MSIKVTVDQGQIFVSSVWAVVQDPNVIVLEIDLKAKYAMLGPMSSHQLMLLKGENTLHAEETEGTTVVTFDGLEGDWSMEATLGRYSCMVFLYRLPDRSGQPLLWSCD